ncbi:hypothetical protein ACJZ2D_005850 [Fusarium nematophilum]
MEPHAKRRKRESTTCSIDTDEASSSCISLNESDSTPSSTTHRSERGAICFGMLIIPTANTPPFGSNKFGPVEIREHDQIFSAVSNNLQGCIRARYANLFELFKNEHIEMEMILSAQDPSGDPRGKQPVLRVVLYGDRDLCVALKEVLEGQNLFLQYPIGATRGVIYRNPQRYFNHPGARTSDFWATINEPETTEEQVSYSDPLAPFSSGDDLDETEPSNHLTTTLKPEYVNNVDGSSQYLPPPSFRGGIVADSMGSGKTLTMIALIAHDKTGTADRARDSTTHGANTTLVILPPCLLDNWQDELSRHLSDAAFSWRCHHGRSKISRAEDLKDVDVLLTTYPTVAAEWRTKRTESVIFSHHWHRVVLDEAHCIKNRSGVTNKAAYDIEASRRWAVTGTPIQDRLPELQGILRFIRAYPYSDADAFDDHFRHEWASGGEQEAVNRLKRLLGFLMLRRSHSTFLPRRIDLRQSVKFDQQEIQIYREAAAKTLKCIKSVLDATHPENGYMNALQKINALRLICTLGHSSIDNNFEPMHSSDTGEALWNLAAGRRALDQFPMLGLNMICRGCHELMAIDAQEPGNLASVHLTKCLSLWCSKCSETDALNSTLCHCQPVCPTVKVLLNSAPPLTGSLSFPAGRKEFPTKVRALVRDLREQPRGTKSIVFSFWKSTLDVARIALDAAGIPFVQVDGQVPSKSRKAIFDQFSSDSRVRVLLLTLSCGAVGLTLTAASRAYLMEPQWNPAIEEQALVRIYRIGQEKGVTTIRFVISDSIEQYVLETQDRKRDLVTVLLSAQQSSSSRVSLERLRFKSRGQGFQENVLMQSASRDHKASTSRRVEVAMELGYAHPSSKRNTDMRAMQRLKVQTPRSYDDPPIGGLVGTSAATRTRYWFSGSLLVEQAGHSLVGLNSAENQRNPASRGYRRTLPRVFRAFFLDLSLFLVGVMDPPSALGIAAAVVQFVDFGQRLLSQTWHIYRSASGEDLALRELSTVSGDLTQLAKGIRDALDRQQMGAKGAFQVEDDLLLRICGECDAIAAEIKSILPRVNGTFQSGIENDERAANKPFFKCIEPRSVGEWFREVLSRCLKGKELEEINDRLNQVRQQIMIASTMSIWSNSRDTKGWEQRFSNKLDTMIKTLDGAIEKTAGMGPDQVVSGCCGDDDRANARSERGKGDGIWTIERGARESIRVIEAAGEITDRLWSRDWRPEGSLLSTFPESTTVLARELKQSIRESLRFDFMNDREERIPPASQSTYQWDGGDRLLVQMVSKAQGVFLWTSIVSQTILQAIIEGASLSQLQAILDSMPAELENLYDAIYSTIPERLLPDASVMLQIQVSACAPVEWVTLWLADETRGTVSSSDFQALRIDQLQASLKRRLSSRTRGILDPVHATRTVDFVHRTATD